MSTETVLIEEPKVAKLLFSDPRFGWLWLPLRLYLGYMWFEAGWHKFVDPKWMGSGEALLDFWKRGLKMTPKPVIVFDWYRGFIEYLISAEAHTWFSKIIIFWRTSDRYWFDSWRLRRRRCILRWTDELELYHGRFGVDQRHALRDRHLARAGVA